MSSKNRKINPHQTYHDLLSNLSKEELTKIRKNINIEEVSHLNKKYLIEAIENCVPRAIENWLHKQTERTVNFIKTLIENDGLVRVEIRGEETCQFLEYFQQRGIVFYGKHNDNTIAIMPYPVLNRISFILVQKPKTNKIIKKNTEVLRIVLGSIVYYGTIHLFKLMKIIKKIIDIDVPNVIEIMDQAKEYEEDLYIDDNSYLYYKYVEDHRNIIEERKKWDCDYYRITKKEGVQAYWSPLPVNNQSYNDFEKYIQKFYKREQEVIDCIFTVSININNGIKYWELLSHMTDNFLIGCYSDLRELHNYLLPLYNNTRLWKLKGHTLLEIGESIKFDLRKDINGYMPVLSNFTRNLTEQRKNVNKVGRNDPCPCGSGIKYKYCCLKKDK